MWIIPKNHPLYSQFAPDMVASKRELKRQLGRCRRSLMWRSKPTRMPAWLLRWKRTSWFRSLCSRILKHSARTSFEIRLISSLPDTLASHSATPAAAVEEKTPDIFGRGSGMPLPQSGPESVFLKTSKGTSPSDSEKSLPIWLSSDTGWKAAVANQRGDYSQRLNAAHRIRENESLSWPTVTTDSASYREKKYCQGGTPLTAAVQMWPTANVPNGGRTHSGPISKTGMTPGGKKRQIGLEHAVRNWGTQRVTTNVGHPSPQCAGKGSRLEDQAAMWQTPETQNQTGYQNQRDGSKIERLGTQVLAWPTPVSRDHKGVGMQGQLGTVVCGQPDPENHNTHGKSQEPWPTPKTPTGGPEKRESKKARGSGGIDLQTKAAEAWPTPNCPSEKSIGSMAEWGGKRGNKYRKNGGHTLKLNPNWVEQLMGIPVGWTDLGSWGME